jgi:hypothetical protein
MWNGFNWLRRGSSTGLLPHDDYLQINLITIVVMMKNMKMMMTGVKSDKVNWHIINRQDGDE